MLRGAVGDEVVSIVEEDKVKTFTLNKTETSFETKQSKILIIFTNENGLRDIFFHSNVTTTIKSLRFNEWKCGSSAEKPECEKVRNGEFFQSDTYTITFGGIIHDFY